MHRQAETERARWMNGIKQQPGAHEEHIGPATALRDGQGHIRDMQYRSGDVRFRSFEYDQNNDVRKMIVDSKSQGVQVWTRGQQGVWTDQHGRVFQGEMKVDQQSGMFTFTGRDGQTHSYGASGQRDNPADRNMRSDRAERTVSQQARESYERNVGQAYGDHEITDRKNYRDNLWKAGAEGKPVVMTFGRSSDPHSQELVDNIKKAQAASGGKAEFMFVDLDKFDPNSREARDPNCPIGKYARDYIGRDFGTPLTMVFNQAQGDLRTPVVPQAPGYHVVGDVDVQKLTSAINEAAEKQQKLNVPGYDRTREGERDRNQPEKPPTPKEVLAATVNFDVNSLEKRMSKMDYKDRCVVYQLAIAEADKSGNKELMGRSRAMLGLAAIKWAGEQAALGMTDDAYGNYKFGSQYLLTAGLKQDRLYHYPGFRDAVMHSGLPADIAGKIIERGKINPTWFLPQDEAGRRDPAKTAAWFKAAMNDLVPESIKQTFPKVPQRPGQHDNYQYDGETGTERPSPYQPGPVRPNPNLPPRWNLPVRR